MRLGNLTGEAWSVAQSVADAATGLLDPTLRLGVTGLARAGKTVFITALVNALVEGGRLPVFRAYSDGRLAGARIAPQPDDAVPRFEVEDHLAALTGSRRWPESTRRVSELRVVIDYASTGFWRRRGGANSKLTLDIVDYPGEWLLDLGLLGQSYAEWSRRTIAASRGGSRAALAVDWHGFLATMDPAQKEDEATAKRAAELFTAYLRACREERFSLSTLPPGRFLMPGDLEGSPALTFAPLDVPEGWEPAGGSIGAMMQRRYDAYVDYVVRPFFREHFARLDRQIVLVDVLAALNAGPDAVADLETALADVLEAFRHGRNSWLTGLFRPRVDRVLFAATKADHLHHMSHDRLEAILRRLVERAAKKAAYAGADVDVVALAAVRATREGKAGREELPVIIGTPEKGGFFGSQHFDGVEEFAVYPGELPTDPEVALRTGGFRGHGETGDGDLRFPRFLPPLLEPGTKRLPHIRLDRAMQFLMGDALA